MPLDMFDLSTFFLQQAGNPEINEALLKMPNKMPDHSTIRKHSKFSNKPAEQLCTSSQAPGTTSEQISVKSFSLSINAASNKKPTINKAAKWNTLKPLPVPL